MSKVKNYLYKPVAKIFFLLIVMSPLISSAGTCGIFGKKITFSDQATVCVEDFEFLKIKGLMKSIPNESYSSKILSKRSYAIAITADPKRCPFSQSMQWNWDGEDGNKAKNKCDSRIKTAVKLLGKSEEIDSCKCEVLINNGNVRYSQTKFNEKLNLYQLQLSLGGEAINVAQAERLKEERAEQQRKEKAEAQLARVAQDKLREEEMVETAIQRSQINESAALERLKAAERKQVELEAQLATLKAQTKNADKLERYQAELEAQLAVVQQSQVKPAAPIGPSLSVHAIVIGNGAYQGSGRLENPINDARAISTKLKSMGFKVTTVENADRTKLVSSLVKFSASAADSDLTLFFYAGHGVQISGTNYMLPTDTNLNQIGGVELHGISLNSVVDGFLPGKTKLVFLDACRDNPLLQVASRSVSRGLAPISVSQGTLISYATKDGSVAADGDGKNSPFTKALLQHIDSPEDIAVVLRRVRDQVMRDTGGQQQPWEYGSLSGGSLILSAIRAK